MFLHHWFIVHFCFYGNLALSDRDIKDTSMSHSTGCKSIQMQQICLRHDIIIMKMIKQMFFSFKNSNINICIFVFRKSLIFQHGQRYVTQQIFSTWILLKIHWDNDDQNYFNLSWRQAELIIKLVYHSYLKCWPQFSKHAIKFNLYCKDNIF